MFNCSDDVLAHHNDETTLPFTDRDNMRARRNTNRDRLKDGLSAKGLPSVLEFKSQGSYAMRTMVRHPDNDYDIDDGTYFDAAVLIGSRGGEMTALQARCMVRDAVDNGSFNKAPEVRTNCVRIYYALGYHVDMPVYRRVTTKDFLGNETVHHELASSDWIRSDARDVTEWFEKENNRQSPDSDNGRQLRRMVRLIKKFARSRDSWKGQILSGFGITKLVTERFHGNADREDEALYYTMKGIRDRLQFDLVVRHPVTPGATITKGTDDAKARFLRDKLTEALETLAILHRADCTRENALLAWDRVFCVDTFEERYDAEKARKLSTPAILTSGLLKSVGQSQPARAAVQKSGGGNYA